MAFRCNFTSLNNKKLALKNIAEKSDFRASDK
jgi:hypothetical protein